MFEAQFVQLIDGAMSDEEGMLFLKNQAALPVTGPMLAVAAQALRERMSALAYPGPLLDTCGTGGDQQSTLNISTASALVLAGAGVKVAKHGNRAVSSTSGSSDVLAVLGVDADMPAELVVRSLDEANLGFCFAPRFHPRLKSLAPLRKQLGIPTIFNMLGPLCNPCTPCWQVMGVGRLDMLRPMSEALLALNVERAAVVHGEPRLDEVSLQGSTQVCLIDDSKISEHTWTAADFGLPDSDINTIRCQDAHNSARHITAILQDEDVPGRPWVLANAALSLFISRKTKTLQDGVQLAAEVVRSGLAWRCLEQLQRLSANSVRPASM